MKKECDCGCQLPSFTTPEGALRFLYHRFNDGVAEGPASYYQRDIKKILDKFYDEPREKAKVLPNYEKWTTGTTSDGRVYIQDDDFKYDARLYVDGDFRNDLDKLKYAVTITEILNKHRID